MALLEALLLAAAQAATAPPPTKAEPPPPDLLEFLADWSEEDGKFIDKEKSADRPEASRKRTGRTARGTKGTTP